MNIHVRRRNNAFIGIRQFGADNSADFPAGGKAALQFAEISTVVELIAQLTADHAQRYGEARFSFNTKGIARENLREKVDEISDISRSMEYEYPGIQLKFGVERNLKDAELLAKAKAIAADAAEYREAFIDYLLKPDFLNELQSAVTAFEDSFGAPLSAVDEQVGTTAQIDAAVRRGMIARNILDGLVKQKYKNNPGKLAAWKRASHIERYNPNDDDEEPPTV